MYRLRELTRVLLAIVLITGAAFKDSAAQVSTPLEVGTRTWIGQDANAPQLLITIDTQLTVFSTADDAHVHHQQSLLEGVNPIADSEVLSIDTHDIDTYYETVTSFIYQTTSGNSGVGQQILAQLGTDTVRAVLTVESLDGSQLSVTDLESYRSGLAYIIVNVFTTDPSPDEPVDSGAGWTGGIMDRLPPLQLHPADSVQLTSATDAYLVGDTMTSPSAESSTGEQPPDPTDEVTTPHTQESGAEGADEPENEDEEITETSDEADESGTQDQVRGNGWIAYSIPDPHDPGITFIRPDGSASTRISVGFATALAWSHDGTMFAFAGPTHPMFGMERSIFILKDGAVHRLPDTEGCTYPAFTSDNLRVIYVCIPPEAEDEMGPAMAENSDRILTLGTAQLGTIRSSSIDGTHSQVEYEITEKDLVNLWDDPAGPVFVVEILVSPANGTVLVTYSHMDEDPLIPRAVVFNSDFDVIHSAVYDDSSIFPKMLPDGTIVTGTHCDGQLCPNGLMYDLETLDGTKVTDPLLTIP